MENKPQELRCVIASDVAVRDGIGIEIYLGDTLVLEIFRDDTQQTRTVTLYKKDLPLELVEQAIALFKRNIPWEFIGIG